MKVTIDAGPGVSSVMVFPHGDCWDVVEQSRSGDSGGRVATLDDEREAVATAAARAIRLGRSFSYEMGHSPPKSGEVIDLMSHRRALAASHEEF